jgi:hypothetical protein
MSYHEQASKINQKLKEAFEGMDEETITKIVNSMLYFGQVAKFRCRSNSAYDGFTSAVFRDIKKTGRVHDDRLGFDVSQVIE